MHCHVSSSFRSHLLSEVSSDAATCPMTLDIAFRRSTRSVVKPLRREVRSEAIGYVVASEPTSAGR
jgi:hypothetical protein